MSTDWCILGFYEFKVVLYCRLEFMMSIDIFISIYISFISGRISTLVTEAAVYFLFVVFTFGLIIWVKIYIQIPLFCTRSLGSLLIYLNPLFLVRHVVKVVL